MEYPKLGALYDQQSGKVSDKWVLYLREYDRLLDRYQSLPVRLLEIGIQNGGSLEKWSNFFPHAKFLIGCDINPACEVLTYDDSRISVIVGDANAYGTASRIFDICSEFDIVIDDGSHRSSDIIRTFSRYFSHVCDGGVFVAEDLHCSYWKNYEGGLFDPMSSIAFFKRLADIVSHEHWGVVAERRAILASFSAAYGENFDEEILSHIHSVEFINSICVIRKQAPSDNVLGWRVVSGHSEPVFSGLKPLHLTPHVSVDESENVWNDVTHLPEDELRALKAKVCELISSREELLKMLKDAEARENGAKERASIAQAEYAKLTGIAEAQHAESIEVQQAMRTAFGEQHAQMLRSTSWRVTAPLRWLSSLVAKPSKSADR